MSEHGALTVWSHNLKKRGIKLPGLIMFILCRNRSYSSCRKQAARSEYKKAQFEKEKTILNLKDVERKIITEVGNAYGDVRSYEQSIPYMVATVNLQNEKLTEEAKRYAYGRSNTKRIIDYQNDLLNAQREETEYLYRHKAAFVDLDRAHEIQYF